MEVKDSEATLRGFDCVRVEKAKVIETLKKNRKDHRKIYMEAIDGWQKAVTEALEEAVKLAKTKKEWRLSFSNLVRPEDHTEDYDQAIEMLEWSLDDELELSYQEFRTYIMDEWGWHQAFVGNSMSYSSTAQTKYGKRNK